MQDNVASGQVNEGVVRCRSWNYTALCFQACSIILIVSYHVNITGFQGPLDLFPAMSYFVQGFAFISGYLYSTVHDMKPARYLLARTRRLMVPALLVHLCYGILVNALRCTGFIAMGEPLSLESIIPWDFDLGAHFMLNGPMWFIPPFYFAQCLYVAIRHIVKRVMRNLSCAEAAADVLTVCVSVSGGMFFVALARDVSYIPGALENAVGKSVILLSWIATGRLFSAHLEDRLYSISGGNWAILALLLLFQPIIFYAIGGAPQSNIAAMEFAQEPLATYFSGITGILFLWTICRPAAPRLGEAGRKLVHLLGSNTMSIMCHHVLGFFVLNGIFYIAHKVMGGFGLFDINRFRTEAFYHYYPHGIAQFAVWYIFFGIGFSLLVHKSWLIIKYRVISPFFSKVSSRTALS